MTNAQGKFGVNPTESETTRTVGNPPRGSRETPETPVAPKVAGRSEKARSRTSDMHVAGESDSSIVPKKLANNGGVALPAESAEGRGLTKENVGNRYCSGHRAGPNGKPLGRRSRGLSGVRFVRHYLR